MLVFKRVALVFFLLTIVITVSSWGFLVHRTLHQLVIYQLPINMQAAFFANADYLIKHSTRPDTRRKDDPSEDTKHFIDFEAYGPNAVIKMPFNWQAAISKYSVDTLKKYGYLPYVIANVQQQLTNAFKAKLKDSILFYAADLGHYIADAHVPLHTTLNYDGQLTNQKGIHSLWETMVPEIELNQFNLYTPHKASYIRNTDATIWKVLRKSHALLPNLLLQEQLVTQQIGESKKYRIQMRRGKEVKYYTSEFAKAYHVALKNSINEQLILSSNCIADFWFTAWVNSGKPNLEKIFSQINFKQQEQLVIELNAFKENSLIKNNLLQAKNNNKEIE